MRRSETRWLSGRPFNLILVCSDLAVSGSGTASRCVAGRRHAVGEDQVENSETL
jgi:hypothetical protein